MAEKDLDGWEKNVQKYIAVDATSGRRRENAPRWGSEGLAETTMEHPPLLRHVRRSREGSTLPDGAYMGLVLSALGHSDDIFMGGGPWLNDGEERSGTTSKTNAPTADSVLIPLF